MSKDFFIKLCVVFSSSLMILIVLIYQGSYAYFTSSFSRAGVLTSETKTLELEDIKIIGTSTTSSNNMIPGESVSTSFQVVNPNSLDVTYDLIWRRVTNTFVNKNSLIVTLKKGSTFVSVDNSVFPSGDSTLVSGLTIAANSTDTYTLTVTYLNNNSNQYEDMGKSFSGTIGGVLGNELPNLDWTPSSS